MPSTRSKSSKISSKQSASKASAKPLKGILKRKQTNEDLSAEAIEESLVNSKKSKRAGKEVVSEVYGKETTLKKTSKSEGKAEDDNEEGDAGAESDSSVLLHGFSSESDSSDEDDDDDKLDGPAIDVGKLPTVAKDDASVKRKLEKAKKQPAKDTGVVYLGRIPHGFFEDQMKAYFSQFGDVTRLRLSRNKKTGRSKHYAFIEFSSAAVAQIVAETMDNYLLMGHILRCKVISKEEVHPQLWVGANKKFRRVPRERIERVKQNKERTEEEKKKVEEKLMKRQSKKKRKLAEAGIDYDLSAVGYSKKTKSTTA